MKLKLEDLETLCDDLAAHDPRGKNDPQTAVVLMTVIMGHVPALIRLARTVKRYRTYNESLKVPHGAVTMPSHPQQYHAMIEALKALEGE